MKEERMGIMTISEIRKIFDASDITDIADIIKIYSTDNRAGVRKTSDMYLKKHDNYLEEIERIKTISRFENECYDLGNKTVTTNLNKTMQICREV